MRALGLLVIAWLGCYQTSGLDEFAIMGNGGGGSGGASSTVASAGGAGGVVGCGDGAVQPGEQCDDHNATADDGCTDCRFDCRGENEFSDPSTNHCYRTVMSPVLAWAEARAHCASIPPGFDLAVIATVPERDFVAPQVAMFASRLWLGATDAVREGVFVWINGEPFIYRDDVNPWQPGEPSDSGDGEDCIELLPEGTLNDAECVQLRPMLCERLPLP